MTDDQCISCGMPMREPKDHATHDVQKRYCHHCARADGSMKSYDETLLGMTAFLQSTQGLDATVAGNMAREMMRKMPAWREQP